MNHAVDDSRALPLPDEAATLTLGAALARALKPGMTVWLQGDLGAGKTTLTRGLLRELGWRGRVKSPTYTLVELYEFSSFNLYHFDLYRFGSPDEWHEAGFRDTFNDTSICLVEWPEKGAGCLPAPDVEVCLDILDDARLARVRGLSEAGRSCIARLDFSSSSSASSASA
jgi:tRNA threonylcarbamoyladenosine biosynthesis protein TsaE